jgi:hypothetical protein
VIYALEFYLVDEDGRQEPLTRQEQKAESLKLVEARARPTLKNVLLKGRRANLCVIKDRSGKTLSVAVSDYKLGAAAQKVGSSPCAGLADADQEKAGPFWPPLAPDTLA